MSVMCKPTRGMFARGHRRELNGGSRDEFLNGETFCSMREVEMLAERWRVHCDLDRDSLQPIGIGAPL
jgi:hypothetical protein